MKKVAVLCVIFLPVFLFAVNVDGNLFDYSAEMGNKAIDGIKDITEKVNDVTDKLRIFSTNPDVNPIMQDGGLIGWLIGDKSTVTNETLSKGDFIKALEWEGMHRRVGYFKYIWLCVKYTFKSDGFYKINDDITFSLDNPYVYPPEEEEQ